MKHRRLLPLLSAAALALLLLCTASCRQDPAPSPTDEPTVPSTDASTTDAETSADLPAEADVTLSDGAVVVLSPYASDWEKTAADALAAELGLQVVSEQKIPQNACLLVVGYSTLNSRFDVDFDALGDLGYAVTASDGAVLVTANTEAGLADAVASFRAALTEERVIPAATHTLVQKHAEQGTTPAYTGEWAENISYAASIANGVSTHFLDVRRTVWQLANQNVVFTFEMKKENCFTSITNKNGIPYALNTGEVFIVDADGNRYDSTSSRVAGRTNTYQLGYYYYNSHILDQNFGIKSHDDGLQHFSIDRTFHIYSDKVNLVQHLTTTGGQATGLSAYGQTYRVEASRVKALTVKDKNGCHATLEGVDWNSCEYVGFDIDRAGIMGFILLPYEENEGKLTVTLADGAYVVEQIIENNVATVYPIHAHVYFGLRLYTDPGHDLEAFVNEAECERHPLESLYVGEKTDGSGYAGYDALRGAYRFTLNGGDFNYNYYTAPDKYYTLNACLDGDSRDRKIYVYTHTAAGALECSVILDGQKTLLPIPLEVGKNFTGENEDSFYLPGDVSYGETFFPIVLKAGEEKEFTILNLYQNWGRFPLKQLSSIQFVAPYYHLSTGVTETNCIAPSFVYGKDNWLLPDFRAMSAPLWAGQPQHTAIGQLFVVRYDTADRVTGNIENCGDVIDSYGPVYADVTMNYLSQDERIAITYRHVEMPQTDENRTYYSLCIEVLEDVPFKDFKSNFSLFCFNGRHPKFNKLGYLDENNQHQVVDLGIDTASRYDRFIKLGDEYPFFDYFEPRAADAVNFALIVKDSHIVIGGEAYTGGFLLRDRYDGSLNFGDLTLDLGEVTLKAGDCICVDYILLPWGYVDSTGDENVLNVRADSCIDPYKITAEVGTVLEDTYVPKVRVGADQTATFTLKGGDNNGVVRVYGLTSYQRPVMEELVNGVWVPYTDSTNKAFDGYAVYADEDGTYSVAFVVNMSDAPAEGRTFRVTGK